MKQHESQSCATKKRQIKTWAAGGCQKKVENNLMVKCSWGKPCAIAIGQSVAWYLHARNLCTTASIRRWFGCFVLAVFTPRWCVLLELRDLFREGFWHVLYMLQQVCAAAMGCSKQKLLKCLGLFIGTTGYASSLDKSFSKLKGSSSSQWKYLQWKVTNYYTGSPKPCFCAYVHISFLPDCSF